ncbi:hypothetical protein D3I17_09490, partial [Enterococcus faecium]|nr:hypothetical protein [Enterococcus faecium]
YIRHEVIGFLIIQYSCWILSGISLAFSRRIESNLWKLVIIVFHLLVICGLGIGWVGISRPDWLLGCVLYFGAVATLDYQKKKKTFYLFGLGLPMLISISLLIWIHYLLAFYFSTKLEDNRIKWLLLGMNYLFATYYNIVLLFFL